MTDIIPDDAFVYVFVLGPLLIAWCYTQAIKAIERGRAERLIKEAQQGVSGPAWRVLEDLRHRIANDSDSLTNRIDRKMDRMFSGRRT